MRALFVSSLLLVAAVSMAQTTISKTNGYVSKIGAPKKGLTSQDKMFMKDAAAGNQFEIKSSEAALKNGSSPFVKMFAKMMITDHAAAFNELKVIGSKKGVPVSKTLTPKQAATVSKLSKLKGAAFDSAYLKAQKDAHMETAMKMEKQIHNGNDSDAKNYAIQTLPAVKEHQKMLMTKKMPHDHKM